MPVTPFHFGLGAALHALAPRHVSFLAFCAANVLIDVESLYNLVQRNHPVHAFFHTYVGATLVAGTLAVLFRAAIAWARRDGQPDRLCRQRLTLRPVTVGAALGAYSHVVLDSLMHRDIQPLAPFASSNALLGVVSLGELHAGCAGLGLVGLVGVGLRRLARRRRETPPGAAG